MGAIVTYTTTDNEWTDSSEITLQKILQQTVLGGGGGSGTTRVFYGSYGDPNGSQLAAGAAVYYDADGSVWMHQTASTNNTNWVEYIA